MVEAVDGPWDRQARTRYLANILTATASPTNFFLTNPAALKRAFETGGLSVLRGGRNMARDLARGGMPQMVNREPFPVGEKLACTPGAVVYRDEIFELLQYAPATPAVHSRPLLMVPPELNRYYILDLAPGRSLVEYVVDNGIQPFMIVWRNPRAELGHGRWGIDDYLAAQAKAAEVVKKITRSDTVNWLGLCAGGITTALMLGYLAATGDASAGLGDVHRHDADQPVPQHHRHDGHRQIAEHAPARRRGRRNPPRAQRTHQLRLAAPERPGVQLPGQRLAARPGPALVRSAHSVDGGWADYALASAGYVGKVSGGMDPFEAAPLTCAGVTTYKAVKVSGARPSDLVAIFGVGGLGHLAPQYALIAGAQVVAVDLFDEKLAMAKELGAAYTVNARHEDPAVAIKALGGADAAISLAVSPRAFEQAYGSLRRGGTLAFVGLPADNYIQLPSSRPC